MSSATPTTLSWPDWLRLEASHWLFVVRTVAGMLLALAIAFRLDLSSPGSAAVTVSIIALPQTGMVLEKSFYRLLGTLLGAVVTLILLANLLQHRDTFILAVALWIGLCTAASAWFRGFQAYGWLLCGYTTCLIGFPAFMDAPHAFDIAIDRVTIVSVGILSAGFVNAVILPSRSTTSLVQQVRRSFVDFAAFLDASTRAGDAPRIRSTQHQFSRDLAQLDAIRASSVFEDPVSRIRSRRLFGFMGGFMFASSRLHLLHRQLDELDARGQTHVLQAVEPLLQAFRHALHVAGHVPATASEAAPLVTQLNAVMERWRELPGRAADEDNDTWAALVTTRALIKESIGEAGNLAALYTGLRPLRSGAANLPYARPRFYSDALQAGISGLRAALLVIVTCAFWIASSWPEGFSMTFLAVVGCALFSSTPNPARAALQMCKGFAIGFPALLVCYTWVLPAASDFNMLSLGLLPFLVFGAWLMTRPGQILVGSGYFLFYLTALNITGVMTYDFIGMINNTLALFVGIVVSTLSLAVIVPADRAWRPQRALQLLLGSLTRARRDRLKGLQARFENQVRDLTLQLIALRPDGHPPDDDEAMGLIVLGLGDAIIRLRLVSARLAAEETRQLLECVDTIIVSIKRQDAGALGVIDSRLAELYAVSVTRSGEAGGRPVANRSQADDDADSLLVALTSLRLGVRDFANAVAPPLLVPHAA
jgi:uncharacterized membrane protein YccC